MTTDDSPAPTRAAARYVSDEPGEIALPGYLNPTPAILEPGDGFTYDPAFVDDVLAAERFVAIDLDDPLVASPNLHRTKAELVDKIAAHTDDADRAALARWSKGPLVELADAVDRANPTPPSDSDPDGAGDDTDTDGNPDR